MARVTDPSAFQVLEEGAPAFRIEELAKHPIEGRFDYEHMKAIHRYIFQDTYEWAGQERVAPVGMFMTKDGPDVVHYPVGSPAAPRVSYQYHPAGPALSEAVEEQYRRLRTKNLLRGLDHKEFVRELAEVWGELNVIHSFREGNTRSQFVFFSQLCEQAGWSVVGSLISVKYSPSSASRRAGG